MKNQHLHLVFQKDSIFLLLLLQKQAGRRDRHDLELDVAFLARHLVESTACSLSCLLHVLGQCGLGRCLAFQFLTLVDEDIGVQTDHRRQVLQRILLAGQALGFRHSRTDDGLHFFTVDDTGQVGVGHGGTGQDIVDLDLGFLGLCAVDVVELLEGTLGPDDEAAQVATGGEL